MDKKLRLKIDVILSNRCYYGSFIETQNLEEAIEHVLSKAKNKSMVEARISKKG